MDMETYCEKINRLNESYTYKDVEIDGAVFHYLIVGEPKTNL